MMTMRPFDGRRLCLQDCAMIHRACVERSIHSNSTLMQSIKARRIASLFYFYQQQQQQQQRQGSVAHNTAPSPLTRDQWNCRVLAQVKVHSEFLHDRRRRQSTDLARACGAG